MNDASKPVMKLDEAEENGCYSSSSGQPGLRRIFRAETSVEYYDREDTADRP